MEARLLAPGRHSDRVACRRPASRDENHRRDRSGERGTGSAGRGADRAARNRQQCLRPAPVGRLPMALQPYVRHPRTCGRRPHPAQFQRYRLLCRHLGQRPSGRIGRQHAHRTPLRCDRSAETHRRREHAGGLHPLVGDRGPPVHSADDQHQFCTSRIGLRTPCTPHLRLGHHAAAGERRTVAQRGARGAETRAFA